MCCGGEGGGLMGYHSVFIFCPPSMNVIFVAVMKSLSEHLPRELILSWATPNSSGFDDIREPKLLKFNGEVRHDRQVRPT